ncbi:MAG: primosomal protein N' [bacterium]
MSEKSIAEVIIHGGPDKSFFYKVAPEQKETVKPGNIVNITLRSRPRRGFVTALHGSCPYSNLKNLSPYQGMSLNRELWRLCLWLAEYYACHLSEVLKNAVPCSVVNKKTHFERWVTLGPLRDIAPKGKKQIECLKMLMQKGTVLIDELENIGIHGGTLENMAKKSWIRIEKKEIIPEEARMYKIPVFNDTPNLNQEQSGIIDRIVSDIKGGDSRKPYLLHGVTGSGKTFVYIDLAIKTIKQGKSVLILVPEISLTPQTIARFKTYFQDQIAIWHSRLSNRMRQENWQAIIAGEKRIVVGVRSAVFSPLKDLGLIIVDEEYDASYKQGDSSFRYNARDVAVMRAHMVDAVCLLGSATPSLESYQNGVLGKYRVLEMQQRYSKIAMPKIEIVDLNREREQNNWNTLSKVLEEKIRRRIQLGEQTILLLNRRGYTNYVICNECGFVQKCKDCDISLTYHRDDNMLLCHYCGKKEKLSGICLKCGSNKNKGSGVGIQKVEKELINTFPQARIMRLDIDIIRKKGGLFSVLEKFEQGEGDILLGTQMVSKGLDFPKVTLVGVILAETSLFLPDFKSSERTYQLLSQVAGRAGRREKQGEVVFQTYRPGHPSVLFASENDYKNFFATEIIQRKSLMYPPFSRIGVLRITSSDSEKAKCFAADLASHLKKLSRTLNLSIRDITILGPAEAPVKKIKKKYIWLIMLKAVKTTLLHDFINSGFKMVRSKGVSMVADVDSQTIF